MTEYAVMIDDGRADADPSIVYMEAATAEAACVSAAAFHPDAYAVFSMDAEKMPDLTGRFELYPGFFLMREVSAISRDWDWQICRNPEWADFIAQECVKRRDGSHSATAVRLI